MRRTPARIALAAVIGLSAAAIGGCANEVALICGSDEYYRDAQTVGPLRIPDDLSIPDETDSLRVPDVGGAVADERDPSVCLEAAPGMPLRAESDS